MRVKTSVASKKRKKRLLKQTKGFWGQRKNVFKRAKETLLRGMAFSYRDRRVKKVQTEPYGLLELMQHLEKKGLHIVNSFILLSLKILSWTEKFYLN